MPSPKSLPGTATPPLQVEMQVKLERGRRNVTTGSVTEENKSLCWTEEQVKDCEAKLATER